MQADKLTLEASEFRSSSPWDKFSASPSPCSEGLEIEMRRSDGIPKLTPEIEQGNVEYKLILKNPSAERLQKLVTQLNWRLMEGNGEAYYQLGVADSGELVGLTKDEMEATLLTLENMAGELGASVVISREIEVRGRLTGLALESINGMDGGKHIDGSLTLLSTSVTSAEASATDTETSEATDDTDDAAADSPAALAGTHEDPDEIIVRSAPVPITHSFLRRAKGKNAMKRWKRDETLKPEDFSSPKSLDNGFTIFATTDEDADDEDPQFGAFDLSDLQKHLPSNSGSQLDPTRPPKSKTPKASKSKGPKPPRQPKGAKPPPTASVPKTSDQIAQKLADKRAKRDKRREERARALLDPVYDHSNLVTQDGGSGKIDYDKIVAEDAEDLAVDGESPYDNAMVSSLATLKPEDHLVQPANHPVTPPPSNGHTISAIIDTTEDQHSIVTPSVAGDVHGEPRLIVEALVVRKAGFGRGFVDLSQFDEELRHLPSFSLS